MLAIRRATGRAVAAGLWAGLLLALAGPTPGQDFISSKDVQRGMRGVGKSVFVGSSVETFEVEVLGVIWNNLAKTDMILCRLSGQDLEHSGTVAGMSGSPIYINGRLAGALAYGYMFSKDPIVGVTPIDAMLRVMGEDMTVKPWRRPAPRPPAPESGRAALEQWWNAATLPLEGMMDGSGFLPREPALPGPGAMMPLVTPLVLGGVPAHVADEFRESCYARGWVPLAMPGAARPSRSPAPPPQRLEPGASVGIALMTGDVEAAAIGTLTWQDGDRFVAFGHPMDQAGPTDLPFNPTYVVHVMAMMNRSFKLGYALDPIGSLRQDRQSAVAGVYGPVPEMLPVRVRVRNPESGRDESFRFEVARNPAYLPMLVRMGLFSCLEHRERLMGPNSIRLRYRLALEGHDDLEYENYFSGSGSLSGSFSDLSQALSHLLTNPYQEVGITAIEVEASLEDRTRMVSLTGMRLVRERVQPGQALEILYELSYYDEAPRWERFELELPASLPEGRYQITLAAGPAARQRDRARAPAKYVTDNIPRMLELLRDVVPNNSLYFTVTSNDPGATVSGRELPNLPGSVLFVHSQTRETGGVQLVMGDQLLEQAITLDAVVAGSHSMNFVVDRKAPPAP